MHQYIFLGMKNKNEVFDLKSGLGSFKSFADKISRARKMKKEGRLKEVFKDRDIARTILGTA